MGVRFHLWNMVKKVAPKRQGEAYHQSYDICCSLIAVAATVSKLTYGSDSCWPSHATVCLDWHLRSQWESPLVSRPSSTGFGCLTWKWTQLDAKLGMNTASKTVGGQFEDRGMQYRGDLQHLWPRLWLQEWQDMAERQDRGWRARILSHRKLISNRTGGDCGNTNHKPRLFW